MRAETFKETRHRWEIWIHELCGAPDPRESIRPAEAARPDPQVTIREIMTADPTTVRPETPLHEALGLLIRTGLSALPVVDANGAIVGLLRELNLMQVFSASDVTSVAAVMDRDPMTVEVDDPVLEVVDRMMANDLRRLLVRAGPRLVGIVTREDLMPTILEALRQRIRQTRH